MVQQREIENKVHCFLLIYLKKYNYAVGKDYQIGPPDRPL